MYFGRYYLLAAEADRAFVGEGAQLIYDPLARAGAVGHDVRNGAASGA